jgi:hypothetical protein
MLKTFELNLRLEQNKSVLCRLAYAVNTVTYLVLSQLMGINFFIFRDKYQKDNQRPLVTTETI